MDIRDLVQRLNSIRMEDLQNIRPSMIKDYLMRNPHVPINILIVMVSVVFMMRTYVGNRIEMKNLKLEIPKLEEKRKVLEENKKIQAEFDEFVKGFPEELDTDGLTSQLSDLAVINNVQILSRQKTVEISEQYNTVTNLVLDISSEDFTNIVNFTRDIEALPFALRLSFWSGKLNNGSPQSGRDSDNKALTAVQATIEVQAIKLKP